MLINRRNRFIGIKPSRIGLLLVASAMALLPAVGAHAAAAKPQAKSAKAAKATKATKDSKPARAASVSIDKRSVNRVVVKKVAIRDFIPAAAPSFGHLYGLQKSDDALDLASSVAYVVDQDTDEVLFSKNPNAVLPIASITKLMTALVVTEAGLPLDETLTVAQDDVDATTGSSSRLRLGTQLRRGEMLHLALMSSENRAAHVLGRSYPGGIAPFIDAMNLKARELGMVDTRYVEPTGLSSSNQSSAQDLTRLVKAAFQHPIIRDLSTSPEASVPVGARQVQFRNTNGLVRSPQWDIGLQKTGYISAAGRCLVMQAQMAGRKLIMVLLDSAGKYSRIGDAERIRKWVGSAPVASVRAVPAALPALAPGMQLLPSSPAVPSTLTPAFQPR